MKQFWTLAGWGAGSLLTVGVGSRLRLDSGHRPDATRRAGGEVALFHPNGMKIIQPKVARNALPWVIIPMDSSTLNGLHRWVAMMQPRWGWDLFL